MAESPNRAATEAKIAAFLDGLTEPQEALLFFLLRNGREWTSERATLVLKREKWWLA